MLIDVVIVVVVVAIIATLHVTHMQPYLGEVTVMRMKLDECTGTGRGCDDASLHHFGHLTSSTSHCNQEFGIWGLGYRAQGVGFRSMVRF